MELTSKEYNKLLEHAHVPEKLKKELADQARESSWAFVGC